MGLRGWRTRTGNNMTLGTLWQVGEGEPMGIHDFQRKIDEIVSVISNKELVATFTDRLGKGPALHFYKKLLESQRRVSSLDTFIGDQHTLELCYGVLGLWGMDTRGAEMLDFDSFSEAVRKVHTEFLALEAALTRGNDTADAIRCLGTVYDALNLMRGNCKLISNAKLLHFCFPNHLMPMDGLNTLMFLYGNTSESKRKYLDITQFANDVRQAVEKRQISWTERLDDGWNSSIPKMVDNAIIIHMSQKRKKGNRDDKEE
jgi:hypothetical protein